MPGVFSASAFRMEWSSQRSMCRLVYLFHTPYFELAISRMKRGGIEEIAISCIFLTWLVWSVPPPPEHWHWCLQIPIPLHWTFHPWSSKEALENILRNVWSFLFTHPRGVLPVWHWAGGRHFALCSTSSFSLTFWVGPSRMVVVHLVCSVHTPEHKEAPIMEWWWEEVDSIGGLMSFQSDGSSQGRKGHLQQSSFPLHMVPPPTGLSPFSSLCRHWL